MSKLKEKLPNILFFVVIILGGIFINYLFEDALPITPKNLPVENIIKIEVKNIQNSEELILTEKNTIDSLISFMYDSKPIGIESANISRGLYYLRIFYTDGSNELLRFSQSKKQSEGLYYWRNNHQYKSDSTFRKIESLF